MYNTKVRFKLLFRKNKNQELMIITIGAEITGYM